MVFKRSRIRIAILTVGLLICFALLGQLALAYAVQTTGTTEGSQFATPAQANSYTYSFTISRAQLPPLTYTDMTYVVRLGVVTNPVATVNGIPALRSSYQPTSGTFIFSSNQVGLAQISFISTSAPTTISVTKASLKDNKAWAWSHGMDDNTNLQAQIDLIRAKGWRATLFMIGEDVSETRNESWIVDQPGLVELINAGWNVGNHTWSHACYGSASAAEILDGQAVVERAVAASAHPERVVISFAAPCFDTEYVPIFDALRNGTTTLLVNELGSGSPALMNVDGSDVTVGDITAMGVSSADYNLGRDTTIGRDTSAMQTFDWMAANAGADRHFWFNTLTHGDNEAALAPVLDYAYDTYGPDGTNELWMAPEDEIYSYLLVRDQTTITGGELSVGGPVAFYWNYMPLVVR